MLPSAASTLTLLAIITAAAATILLSASGATADEGAAAPSTSSWHHAHAALGGLRADGPAITSLADPRYGMEEPDGAAFEASRVQFWELLQRARRLHAQEMRERHGCFCDGYGNATVWDETREDLCRRENALRAKHFPPRYVVDARLVSATEQYTEKAVRGAPRYGVPFDPDVMRLHLRQLRAMLAEYYEGKDVLESSVVPTPTDPAYGSALEAIALRFVRKIVHGKPIVIAVLGNSIMAGMDNCFDNTYGPLLTRTLRPFFSAMGVGVDVRMGGQNGDGASMDDQIICAKALIGDDVDVLQSLWSMIGHPPPTDIEAHIRRTLSEGILYHSFSLLDGLLPVGITNPKKWNRDLSFHNPYLRTGLVMETPPDGPFTGLQKQSDDLYPWFPALGKSHWGRKGDGRCHMRTRENRDGVMRQNWHLGPLGYQLYMDVYVYVYADALILAMDWIKTMGADALKGKYPLDRRLKVNLPPPITTDCIHDMKLAQHPMCTGETDKGFGTGPVCATGQNPSWGVGSNLTDWMIPQDDPQNPFSGKSGNWAYTRIKGPSRIGSSHDKEAITYSVRRECTSHLDEGFAYVGNENTGAITFKLPDMTKGDIQICNINKRGGFMEPDKEMYKNIRPAFSLNGRALDISQFDQPGEKVNFHPSIQTGDGGDYKHSTCMQVAVGAPEKKNAYLGVEVKGTGDFKISWIIVN